MSDSPRPPRGLDSAGRAAWKRAADVLEAVGEDVELSGEALRHYAHAVSDLAALRRDWHNQGQPATVTGGHGSTHEHPLVRSIERQTRVVSDLAGDLGLSPAARRKLGRSVRGGRPFGQAVAPDRKVVPIRRHKGRSQRARKMDEIIDQIGR